jgi:hypothetical protein
VLGRRVHLPGVLHHWPRHKRCAACGPASPRRCPCRRALVRARARESGFMCARARGRAHALRLQAPHAGTHHSPPPSAASTPMYPTAPRRLKSPRPTCLRPPPPARRRRRSARRRRPSPARPTC